MFIVYTLVIINIYFGPSCFVGRVCGGRVGQGPSLLGAEFARGRDVQLPK